MEKSERDLLTIDWASQELPTLPSVAHRLLTMASDERRSSSELADLIGNDPTLAIRILKAVNSAFYSLNIEVTSVRHAIVLLGMNEVRRIALGSILAERFLTVAPAVRPQAEALWRHLLATAVLAEDLAPGGEEDPDLYTLGLLHDIGWLILLAQAPKVFVSMAKEEQRSMDDIERLWGVNHQLWGARLAEKWGLPEPFQIIALRHHKPLLEAQPPDYLLRVHLANHLAYVLGMKTLNTAEEQVQGSVLERLDLDESTFEEMKRAATADRDRINSLWRALSG